MSVPSCTTSIIKHKNMAKNFKDQTCRHKNKEEQRARARTCAWAWWHTLRVSETSGAGISTTQVFVAIPHPSIAGMHLHRGIDLRSYDSESTRGPANSGAGVPGVAGTDPFGGVNPGSITLLLLVASSLSLSHSFFLVFFFFG